MLLLASLFAVAASARRIEKTIPMDLQQLHTADEDSSVLKNCTASQIADIQNDIDSFNQCIEDNGCGGGADDNNGRRRLQDDEQSFYDMYKCYCNKCTKYLARLQSACTVCDAPNYDDPCAEGNDENGGNCADGAEEFFYEETCIVGGYMVVPHQDTFCSMIKTSKTCLTELEYMFNPPREEEDDDNNNNNRRRLNDNDNEEGMVAAEDILGCWSSVLQGGETYESLTGCSQTCMMYGNATYDYIYNGQEEPVQSCGMAIQEIDLLSETTDLLPRPVQHAGVACVSSSCTAEDAENIMTYINYMSAYSTFMSFDVEGQDGGNNNNDKDDQNQMDVKIGIPSTKVHWRCTGEAAEGTIATEDFPEEEEGDGCEEQESKEDNGSGGSGNDNEAKWATATTFAIVFALGMGVFACLYLYTYRSLMKLRKANAGQPLMNNNQGAPAQANVGYQGVTA